MRYQAIIAYDLDRLHEATLLDHEQPSHVERYNPMQGLIVQALGVARVPSPWTGIDMLGVRL